MAQAKYSILLICLTGLASASLGSELTEARIKRHRELHGLIAQTQGPLIEFGLKSLSATEHLIRSILKVIPGAQFVDFGIKTGLMFVDTLRLIKDSWPGDILALSEGARRRIQAVHAWTMDSVAKTTCRVLSRKGNYDPNRCDTCLVVLADHEAPTIHTMLRDIGERLLGRLYPGHLVNTIEKLKALFRANFIYLDGYVDCKDPAVGRRRRNCRDLRRESLAVNVITIPVSIVKWVVRRVSDLTELVLTLTHGTVHRFFSIKDAYRNCLRPNPFY